MNKFQKAAYVMVKRDERYGFWKNYENCIIGRSIPSAIRCYVKGFQYFGYDIHKVHKDIKEIQNTWKK